MTLINQTVGNYKVVRLLGEGGMGAVYLAEHPVIGRKVAIKVLHMGLSRDTDIVGRFFNEARAIHTIGHPNIVEILDFGQTPDGQPYFIMEYLAGDSLNDRITRGAMPAGEVGELADQMCRALSAAHSKGIVHRDLKPHNVHILTGDDGHPVVKLLDFGVAKMMDMSDTGNQSVKTRTGSLMGTPLYMSPEQCRGSGKLDHRTDIYSLGVMIFEMLAGRPPFVAEGVGELFAMHMMEPAPPIENFVSGVPVYMAGAVMRSLAKSLDDRFATMEDFRMALLGAGSADMLKVTAASRSFPPARATGVKSAGGALAPSPQSTTLSAASSEIDEDLAPPRRRSGLAVAAVAVAAVAVMAVVLLKKNPGGDPATVKPTAAVTSPKPALVPTPPPSPAAPALVTIRMEASPPGVHVFRASDDQDLGAVPVEVKLPKSSEKSRYVFKLDGYKDKSLSTEPNTDRTVHVALERDAPAAPSVAPAAAAAGRAEESKASKRPSSSTKRPARKSKANTDEDGLATPSF